MQTNISALILLARYTYVGASSDVDMSQQQEISSFFRENFLQRICIKQGYSSDSASEAAVYAQRQRCDEQGSRWILSERLFIPDCDNLRFECFESVPKHPFSGHFWVQWTLKKYTHEFMCLPWGPSPHGVD
jgi:hypothetical protein